MKSACKKAPTSGEQKSAHIGRTFALLRGREKSAHIYLTSVVSWAVEVVVALEVKYG
jgi:hypothetical protein